MIEDSAPDRKAASTRQPIREDRFDKAAAAFEGGSRTVERWLGAIDTLLAVLASWTFRDRQWSQKRLSNAIRIYIASVWGSTITICLGFVTLGLVTYKSLASEHAQVWLDGTLFHLTFSRNLFLQLALILLALAVVPTVVIWRRHLVPKDAHWFVLLSIILVIAFIPARRVAAHVLSDAILDHLEERLADTNKRSEALRFAAGISPLLEGNLRSPDILLARIKGHQIDEDYSIALRLTGRMLADHRDHRGCDDLIGSLAELMLKVGVTHTADYCARLLEKDLSLEADIRPSPFRFFTDADWSIIKHQWENDLFGSRSGDASLQRMLEKYPEHPDAAYVHYLLGNTQFLRKAFPHSPPSWLATFHEARTTMYSRSNDETTHRLFAEIVNSPSDQSFVDDAAAHGATVALRNGRPTPALELVFRGYGRGNLDFSSELEELTRVIVLAAPAAERTRLIDEAAQEGASLTLVAYAHGIALIGGLRQGIGADDLKSTYAAALQAVARCQASEATKRAWAAEQRKHLVNVYKKHVVHQAPMKTVLALEVRLGAARSLWRKPNESYGSTEGIDGLLRRMCEESTHSLAESGKIDDVVKIGVGQMPVPSELTVQYVERTLRASRLMRKVCGDLLSSDDAAKLDSLEFYGLVTAALLDEVKRGLWFAQAITHAAERYDANDLDTAEEYVRRIGELSEDQELQAECHYYLALINQKRARSEIENKFMFEAHAKEALKMFNLILDEQKGSRRWYDALRESAPLQQDLELSRAGLLQKKFGAVPVQALQIPSSRRGPSRN